MMDKGQTLGADAEQTSLHQREPDSPHLLRGCWMRFVIGNGAQLKGRLEDFPSAWVGDFLGSKMLVIAVMNDEPVAAYGIRGILNVTSLYVRKDHRRRGIAWRIRNVAFNEARKRGMHFLTGEVSFRLLSSKYGRVLSSEFRCRVVKPLKKRQSALVVFPLTGKGDLAYIFLRLAFSILPSKLLEIISSWISKRTLAQQ